MEKSDNLEKKKQNAVARGSVETKFRAVLQGICEGYGLKELLGEQ